MKILLINPPRSPCNGIYDYAPVEVKKYVHKKLIGPPLGLLTLAAAVKKDHDVTVLELKAEYDRNPDAPSHTVLTEKYIKEIKPDAVGVTFLASELNSGLEILKTAKETDKDILTMAGGLHATLCPEDFHKDFIDVVFLGQAAHSFREVVRAREEKRDFRHIGGIMIRTEEGHVKTNAAAPVCNYTGTDYIMPDRSFIREWIGTYKVGNVPHPSTYVYTSLGCPYKCTFCSIWPQFDGKYMQREVESVISELKTLDDYPVVRLADANTIVDIDFINRLIDRIREEGIRKDLIMDIRFDTAVKYPALMERLAGCGLKVVICGFESFREEDLKRYKKSSKPHLIEEAIRIFHANNIKIRGNYVVPPEYDDNDFKALEDYAAMHPVVYAGYTILTPMPGTAFFREMENSIVDFNLDKYNFFNCVLKTKLPLTDFYGRVGALWQIRKGDEII